jgi:hypothetical protein
MDAGSCLQAQGVSGAQMDTVYIRYSLPSGHAAWRATCRLCVCTEAQEGGLLCYVSRRGYTTKRCLVGQHFTAAVVGLRQGCVCCMCSWDKHAA